ncbi:MAG: hypothetical protein ABJC89_26385, partial [Acidobacteriota bacterium]
MRLIRPLLVARVFGVLLGLSACLPTPAGAAPKTAQKKSSARVSRAPKATRPLAYSASVSEARKARLARARAAVLAREHARLSSIRSLQ